MSTIALQQKKVVILGGGYAGLTMANRLSQQSQNIEITLIDAKSAFVERNRLHQIAAGQEIPSHDYYDYLKPLGVKFLQGHVMSMEPLVSEVTVEDSTGTTNTLKYDYLVYALGSCSDITIVPGVWEYADFLDSEKAAGRIFSKLKHHEQSRVLIVGGGLTGIEIATELAESFSKLQITLATSTSWSENKVPDGMVEDTVKYLTQAFEARNIKVHSGTRINRLDEGKAYLESGSTLDFDVCIWTVGFKPSPLAKQAGIQVNGIGQIEVDQYLRSLSHPNIITVGDAANVSTEEAGPCRMGSATALAMGASGAKTILALLRDKNPPVFHFVYLFRNIGLGRNDGVVQFVDRRDVPRDQIWTGRKAAIWKEHIVKSTLSVIGMKNTPIPPALPPLRTLPQIMQGMQQYV